MRIGELAERSGLSRDTIRFYERNGLVKSEPENAPTNTYRNYGEDTLERLTIIREAQVAGFSIADLIRLFRSMEADTFGSAEDGFDADMFLDEKIREVEDTLARAQKFLEVLQATKRALQVR